MADAIDELFGDVFTPSASPTAPPVAARPAATGGDEMIGAYDGADRFNRDLADWHPTNGSADFDIVPSKPLSDARSRDMLRNDAFVQGGATLHKDNIVGAQFMLNAKPSSLALFGKIDEEWEAAFQEEVEELFHLCAESPANLFDAARKKTFTDLVRLAVGVHVASGEVLATAEWKRDDRPFRTAIQMVDTDRLSTPSMPAQIMLDPNIRAGIRTDNYGVPLSYFIKNRHPQDLPMPWTNPLDYWTWTEVQAKKPWGRIQVIHLFNEMRAAQSRGISAMTAALKEMHITHKFRDVTLQNAVTQALYAATITSDLDTEAVFQRLGAGQTGPQAYQAAISDYMVGWFNTINEFCGNSKNLHVDGVRIPHLPPGTKLDIMSPGKGGPLGMEFEQSLLRYIAATLSVSYEQLSRDYTNTNYSSARAAMTETWKAMQSLKKEIADTFATHIYRLWLEEMVNNNMLSTFPAVMAQTMYGAGDGRPGTLNIKFEALSRCDWIGASRGQIDELKETQAAVLRINNGLSTWEAEIARLGGDWRKNFRQIAREKAMAEKLGLPFAQPKPTDTTNQMNAAQGTPSSDATALGVGTADALFMDDPNRETADDQ